MLTEARVSFTEAIEDLFKLIVNEIVSNFYTLRRVKVFSRLFHLRHDLLDSLLSDLRLIESTLVWSQVVFASLSLSIK